MNQDYKAPVFEYKQNGQRYFNVVLPYEIIDANSDVLVYGRNAGGYQRDAIPAHFNKIKDYILKTKDFILPTSIVLAVDEDDVSKILTKKGLNSFIRLNKKTKTKKIFRIVDGQHRIRAMREALKEALKSNSKLSHFLFDVVILVTKSNKRSVEMEVFYDINSKGKRLKVDLIELARFNYRILEKSFKEKEINEHISIQAAYYLNEKVENCVWNSAIKFGIHDDHVIGIIGVNAFRESISTIVDIYLKEDEKSKFKELKGKELVLYTQKSARKIANFIHLAWDKSIKSKWKYCFKEGLIELDLYFEPKKVYYNQKYYIQRTMGAKAINTILGQAAGTKFKNRIIGLNNHAQILNYSPQKYHRFPNHGFKKVSQIILNTIPVTRSF